jgi:HSP20 family protein
MSDQSSVPATTQPQATSPRRWDLSDWMTEMQADLDRFLNGRWPGFRTLQRMADRSGSWSPRADIYEQDGQIVIKAELPGVKREDLSVEVADGDLVVSGTRKTEQEVKDEQVYRLERGTGTFYRRMTLPEGTDPSKIEASYQDGVLEIHIPKPSGEQAKPTKVAIK